MPSRVTAKRADSEQDSERDNEQQHRERCGTGRVVTVDPLEHIERRDSCLEGEVARDEDDRPELADRTRKRKRDARQKRGQEMREDDPPEDREASGAER